MKFLDLAAVKAINERCLPENYDFAFWEYKFHEASRSDGKHFFVAVCNSKILGYTFCDQEFVISVAIDEAFRNKGIGKHLLYHTLNTYTKPVHLHVRASNTVALKLYTSLGFYIEKTEKDYYPNPTEDGYLMVRNPTATKFPEIRKLNIGKILIESIE